MRESLPQGVILEQVDCPNGCSNGDAFVTKGKDLLHGIPGEFTIYRCLSCNLERTNPRPTPATIGAYYPSDYGPYCAQAETTQGSKRLIKDFLRRTLGLQSRILPPVRPGRMLEVGCSSGNYMQEARGAGWEVEGIEFSPEAAAIARSKGFAVRVGPIEQMDFFENDYDLITAWMVLEHLHEPVKALRKLRGCIRPEGYLVASVPSAKSPSRMLFGAYSYDLHLPNHLFHFTPQTLAIILKTSGWIIERVFWQRNCMTLLNSFHYWAIAGKHQACIKIARWLITGKLSTPIRVMLSQLLGLTGQSGRMEIWAKPLNVNRQVESNKN